jgi:putative IMPACT (imprinted ancient) family translation regulator
MQKVNPIWWTLSSIVRAEKDNRKRLTLGVFWTQIVTLSLLCSGYQLSIAKVLYRNTNLTYQIYGMVNKYVCLQHSVYRVDNDVKGLLGLRNLFLLE